MMNELIYKKDAIKAICEDGTWLERQGCTEITMVERKQRDVDIIENLPPVQLGTDLVSRQAALDAIRAISDHGDSARANALGLAEHAVENLPTVQPESCEGCKHLGKWENEVEYGYPSPCTRCKRRAEDHYER